MNTIAELLHDLLNDQHPTLYPHLERWIRDSRRFRAFATTYRSKIRAKLKRVSNPAELDDVWSELGIAMLLLRDSQLGVEYEKYAATKHRSPDFTVTFKTHTLFNVEVRHIRSSEFEEDFPTSTHKLMTTLCDKVGQMQPNMVNLLWLLAEPDIPQPHLIQATVMLRQLADGKQEDFFIKWGFATSADFLKQYRQLSGVVFCQQGQWAVWQNPLAKSKPLPEVVRAIQRLGTTEQP